MVATRQGARARDHLASLAAPKRQPMCARAAPRAKGWAVPACAARAFLLPVAMLDEGPKARASWKSRVGGRCRFLVNFG